MNEIIMPLETLDELQDSDSWHPGAILDFGKHAGRHIKDVDQGYLRWMMMKADPEDTRSPISRFVRRHQDALDEILDPRVQARRVAVDYTLSASQAAAVDAIENTLLTVAGVPYMRLEGGAGYGKSFAVLEVVRRAMLQGYTVHASATSYVATQVLCQHLEPYGIQPKTMASQLRLAKEEYEDQEEYIITQDSYEQLGTLVGPKNLFIVDEYSMVADDLANMIMEAAIKLGGRLLVVGDLKQLPPVKQAHDTAFTRIPDSVELTEPMRYPRDSALYELEQTVRRDSFSLVSGAVTTAPPMIVGHPDLLSLVNRYVNDYHDCPQESARILFFRRQDVLECNAVIRTKLFGHAEAAASPVIEDETVMVSSTTDIPAHDPTDLDSYYREARTTGLLKLDKRRYYSGETFLVSSVREGIVLDTPCYLVRLGGSRDEIAVMFGMGAVLDQTSRGAEEYSERLAALREEAKNTGDWRAWRDYKNAFLPVSHSYATTTHRAQGATVDRVYLDPKRLQAGPMTSKLLYVAATRARKQVHLVLP